MTRPSLPNSCRRTISRVVLPRTRVGGRSAALCAAPNSCRRTISRGVLHRTRVGERSAAVCCTELVSEKRRQFIFIYACFAHTLIARAVVQQEAGTCASSRGCDPNIYIINYQYCVRPLGSIGLFLVQFVVLWCIFVDGLVWNGRGFSNVRRRPWVRGTIRMRTSW